MTWIKKNKRALRVSILILMVVSFLGPWVFDRVYVPAKYDCAPPFIRLEGDFCGLPLSGIRFIGWLFGGIFSILAEAIKGKAALNVSIFELLMVVLYTMLFLPVILTLLFILRGERKGLQIFHIAACGLSLIMCLWLGSFNPNQPQLFCALWGFWLYTGLLLGALIFEILALKSSSSGQPG